MSNVSNRDIWRWRRAVPVVLIVSSLIVLTISTRSLEGFPRRFGLTVFGFFQQGFNAIGDVFTETITSIAELRKLKKSHEDLLVQLEHFSRMEREFADIRAENDRLKEQLGFSGKLAMARVPARIIAKDPENLYATIVIDKGVDEGIRKSMAVIAFQDGIEGIVGRVLEVGYGTSIVIPIYDSSSYIASRLSKSRFEGLVMGSGSFDEPLVMKYVRKRAKDEIQFGDLVVSSGFESIYPSDIALGRVLKIRSLDYQTSIEVEIDPILDFSRLEYVFVVKITENAATASQSEIK